MAVDNRTLGKFHLDGIPSAPRGVPQIEVTFDIDANGILHVSAKDKATGKEQSIRITSSSGLTQEEVQKMKADAESHAADDKKRREEVDMRNQADQLVFQTDKQLKEFGEKVPEAMKARIEKAKEDLQTAIKSGNGGSIKTAMDGLNNAWNEASSQMYQQTESQSAETPPDGGTEQAKADDKKVEDASYEVVDDKDKK
jgi:molecular chaperone DnaK